MQYHPLDREAARRDPAIVTRWRVTAAHEQASALGAIGTFGLNDDAGAADAALVVNQRFLEDVEWAEGYLAGRRDAVSSAKRREGPGVSHNRYGDAGTASPLRQDGYDLGLLDGSPEAS
jgi:hypothetical protein